MDSKIKTKGAIHIRPYAIIIGIMSQTAFAMKENNEYDSSLNDSQLNINNDNNFDNTQKDEEILDNDDDVDEDTKNIKSINPKVKDFKVKNFQSENENENVPDKFPHEEQNIINISENENENVPDEFPNEEQNIINFGNFNSKINNL